MSSIPVDRQFVRLLLTFLVFVTLFTLVGWRLHFLQVNEAHRMTGISDRQTARTWILPAARGSMYDQSGAPLAESISTWTLTCDPQWMDNRLRATVELSALLGLDRTRLRDEFEAGKNGRVLARGLDDAMAERVKALKLTGVFMRRDLTRINREGALAAHVLGFVQADGSGGMGLEAMFDKAMAGTSGKETLRVDALGRPILTGSESVPARPGNNVQLTIDLDLQREVEAVVAAAVEKHAPVGVACVVVRPSTGEVVAMASWPTFNPTERSSLLPTSMRNNILNFVYEPGSTMKPLIVGAAVAEGLTTFSERIDCEHGAWTYREGRGVRTIREKSGGHGILSVTEGIALSDNIMMAKLGIRLGPERLHQWVTNLGFGRRTGICLPGEDAGIMLPKARWNLLGSCMSVPMGHEVAVTPLQLVMAHAAIANGGLLMPPRLVKRVWSLGVDGVQVDQAPPELAAPRRVYDAALAASLQEAMTRTMTDGTGKGSQLDGYTSAGKTGTAEKLVNGRYSNDHNVGSFVGWAPASPGVRAELVCLFVTDDPTKNGRFGSQVAAPYAARILQGALERMGVPKQADAPVAKEAR